jgi:hypothetical protein
MNNEIIITLPEFTKMMKDKKTYNGCSFAGIDMLTQVKLTGGKKNPMQGRVTKVHDSFVVMLFANKLSNAYENMINRRLVADGKEGGFKVGKLPFGVKVKDTACIEYAEKNTDYLQTIYVQNAVTLLEMAEKLGVTLDDKDVELARLMGEKIVEYKTTNGKVSYLLDGKPIEKSKIQGLPTKKDEGKQGGLDKKKKVIIRSPKLESITRITLGGQRYRITM